MPPLYYFSLIIICYFLLLNMFLAVGARCSYLFLAYIDSACVVRAYIAMGTAFIFMAQMVMACIVNARIAETYAVVSYIGMTFHRYG